MTALALRLNELVLPDALRRHWRAWAVLGAMAVLWLAAAISVEARTLTRPSSRFNAAERNIPSSISRSRKLMWNSPMARRSITGPMSYSDDEACPLR